MPLELQRTLRDFFSARQEFAAVYLFGSRARGTARPDSDVDLALLYRVTPPSTLLAQPYALEAELTELTGHSVECVVLDQAPPDLIHRVLRDGVLLSEHDRSRRIAFEVRARNLYFDLEPFLHAYRSASR